ncbi:MAG: hypothetical protein QMD09_00040 [Desulfatibacillaceae bacterium]|nr:hypothetical protein [Desulfatibacillaceae bacterium]
MDPARLEARVAKLEEELARIKAYLNLDKEKPSRPASPHEEAILKALESSGKPRQSISELRSSMGMKDSDFDRALMDLEQAGRITLIESGGMSLSLSKSASGLMGDDGRWFTQVELKK